MAESTQAGWLDTLWERKTRMANGLSSYWSRGDESLLPGAKLMSELLELNRHRLDFIPEDRITLASSALVQMINSVSRTGDSQDADSDGSEECKVVRALVLDSESSSSLTSSSSVSSSSASTSSYSSVYPSSSSNSSSTGNGDDGGAATNSRVLIEGWLVKQSVLKPGTTNYSRWKKRYFILLPEMLSYYKVSLEGILCLDSSIGCTLSKVENVPKLVDDARSVYTVVLSVPAAAFMSRGKEAGAKEISPENSINSFPMVAATGQLALEIGCAAYSELCQFAYLIKKALMGASLNNSSGSDQSLSFSMDSLACTTRLSGLVWCRMKSGLWVQMHISVRDRVLEFHQRTRLGAIGMAFCASRLNAEDGCVITATSSNNRELRIAAESAAVAKLWYEALCKCSAELAKHSMRSEAAYLNGMSIDALDFILNLRSTLGVWKQRLRDRVRERNALYRRPHVGSDGVCRIIAIDGGGIRGIINCVLLERLASEVPELFEHVNVYAGTSNGSMIASGLAFGYPPWMLRTMIEATAEQILRRRPGAMAAWNRSKCSAEPMINMSREILHFKMGDADKYLMLPSVLLDNLSEDPASRSMECRCYSNILKKEEEFSSVLMENVGDLVLRSSAAPTYFPSHQRHVDGGVFAQNPSCLILSTVISEMYFHIPLDKVRLLSLGTGHTLHYWSDETHDFGLIQWLPDLPVIMWAAMLENSSILCRNMLGDHYFRHCPVLQREIALDDPLQLPELVGIAVNLNINPLVEWIRNVFLPKAPEIPVVKDSHGSLPLS